MTPLERRYRRWLLAYPGEYRRDHEEEILGTLLQAAAPGQARPSTREAMVSKQPERLLLGHSGVCVASLPEMDELAIHVAQGLGSSGVASNS